MRKTNRDRKSFYVVEFIELPFKGIDKYVCVPNFWLVLRRPTNGKVVVTYPDNEDPIDTRDRVERKEKPNVEWRFYMAWKKYESDNYEDAEYWIATSNDNDPGKEKSKIIGTQPKPDLSKKLRCAGQSFSSGPNSDKFQLKAKPNKNPRKPMPRMLMKRPLSQKPDENPNNKRLKLNENANPGAVTDHTIIASGCSKQEQSIIITDNEFTQIDQTKTSSALNGKKNTEQSTPPGVIKENKSVKMLIQSTSTKLSAEQHPSLKLSAQQQLPPQPFSPIEQDDQQPLSISVIDLDEPDEDIESSQNDLLEPVTVERLSTQTLLNILEQSPQPEPETEKSTQLVRREHSLPEPDPLDGSAEQTKKFNNSQKTHLHRILTAPTMELRPPSTVNQPSQHLEHYQLPIFPANSTLNSELRSAELVETTSIKVPGDHQTPCFRDCRDSTPSTSYHGADWGILCEPVAKKQSAAVKKLKNPVDIKTCHKGNSKNITSMQYPLSSMMHFSLPGNPAVTQTTPPTHNHFRQAQVNDRRCSAEEKCTNQKVPVFKGIVNTSTEQNFSKLAHQCSPFVEESREQQYVPTQAEYLQQFACSQDMLKRHTVASTIDRRVYHQNAVMSGEFFVPNPISQPVLFLPQNENQYIPVNSAYAQEVIRHDLMRGPTDGAHSTYQPNVQNGIKIQFVDHYSSSQSHQNSDHPQNYPPIYRDPCTASTQNDLPQNENQYIPVNSAYAKEVIRHDLMRGPTDGAHSTYKPNVQNGIKIQFVDHYSSSQSHQNSEHPPQKHYPPIYRDPCTASTQNDLPQNENQYIPVNSAYAKEVIRHDLMRGPTDGAHSTYKPNVQNGIKIQFVDHYSSSQSHQNSEHPQQKHYPPIYRDPCTASTQNDLPQNENQYIPVNSAYAKEVIRHDLMRGPTDGAHSTYKPNVQNEIKIQFVDHYSSSQSHQNSEHPQQKQYPPIYRDPCTASTGITQNDLTLKSKHNSHMPTPQKITERPQFLSTSQVPSQVLLEIQKSCLLQEQRMQGKINPNSTKYSNTNLAVVPKNLTVEPAPSTKDTYQFPRINKTMVDQATETERASKLVDSACQTGDWLIEEQGSTYQESASDSETAAEQEIESENELDSEVHDKNLPNVRNVPPEDQQVQSRIFAEQEILNAIGALVTRAGTSLSYTSEIFNFVRNSTLECIQEFDTLLEKVDKFNSIETLQIPMPLPDNVTSQDLQMTQKRPAENNDNNTGVGDAVAPICEQKDKFSLPAEYDPNDTKWTLKYRENKPGLVELIPRTGVYVCMKELKRCIRQSNDCRTLARLLLTEIFSQNALSVCSLTGGKAKAFKSLNINVRPGLDEDARMVLLAFVEEHGKKQGWDTFNTRAVMTSIRSKINEIRAKHGQTCKV